MLVYFFSCASILTIRAAQRDVRPDAGIFVVLFFLEIFGIFIACLLRRQRSHCVSALTISYVHLLVLLLIDTTLYVVFFSNIFRWPYYYYYVLYIDFHWGLRTLNHKPKVNGPDQIFLEFWHITLSHRLWIL